MFSRLSIGSLSNLSVGVPTYDRAQMSAGILHFGIGNFHRSHQAVYLDELFSQGTDKEWGLIGAGVRQTDTLMWEKLKTQDWLTTVVERDEKSSSARVTGAMIDYLEPCNTQLMLAKLADPAIRIVSLTITEGGYFIDPASGEFNPQDPEIIVDAGNLAAPKTVFGLILAGLMSRRAAGVSPFTVMSCDNIPGNGGVARDAVAGLAALVDAELADWVRANVAFPDSMVDRITPATSDEERNYVASEYGIKDAWPVVCEPFKQWVVEDHFPAGRPALENVGVTFVDDVGPYENMKIRILNGGHAAMAYPAGLLDIHYVHDAMAHPLVSGYLDKLIRQEVIPVVPPIPSVNVEAYFDQVCERFTNPKVGDTVRRLCLDGSNRQPKFVLPSVTDRLAQGQSITGLALVSAFWCRYCAGTSEAGKIIEPNDPDWARLQDLARQSRNDPAAFLSMEDIFGDLISSPEYVKLFTASVTAIWNQGTEQVLKRYLSDAL